MSEKKGKKGKGKKGKKGQKVFDPNKLNNVDRQFYELVVADLNQKLARLRSHLMGLDESNIGLTEKLRELEEDRVDVAAHLDRQLAERNDTIRELEERLTEITKIREQENEAAQEKIRDLELKYKALNDQLTSEIKLLNGKLNSLDEFRVQRQILLAKFDDQEQELQEKDRSNKEALYQMEQKAVVEKDALKKEVEAKLLQVAEDFTRSSEIRNAGYTRRLIRENIALQKEIDKLVMAQLKMQQYFTEQLERHKDMAERYMALDQMKQQLIVASQNKIRIIDQLTKNYEKLKARYVELLKYRKLYETAVTRGTCDRFMFTELNKKIRLMGVRIDSLKIDKNYLLYMHDQHESEILRLRGIINKIKSAVAITVEGYRKSQADKVSNITETVMATDKRMSETDRRNIRKDLLMELVDLVISHAEELDLKQSVATISQTASLYKPGQVGFLPRQKPSIMEVFAVDKDKVDSEELVPPSIDRGDGKYIPSQRCVDRNTLIDIELGSTLYVSSSHEDIELPPADDDEALAGEEGESSSEEALVDDTAKAPAEEAAAAAAAPATAGPAPSAAPTEPTSKASKMSTEKSLPSGEYEGESESKLYEGEDEMGEEEWSINLFY